MSYKTYVIQDGTEYRYIKVRGFKPENAIDARLAYDPITGELEDPRWIQLEQIADPETGELIPTFTVDTVKQSTIKAQDAALKQAEIDKANADKLIIDDLLTRLINFDPNSVNDLAGIKKFIKDITDYLLFKYREEISKKKAGLL